MPEGQGAKDPQPPGDGKQSQGDNSPPQVQNTSAGGDVPSAALSSVRYWFVFRKSLGFFQSYYF